jgi:DNA polymerase-3 subunit alpha
MKGIALTDHGDMFGIKEFYNYVNKVNQGKPDDEKFKPILGCEMYVVPDMHDVSNKNEKRNHLIVLAKNLKGYKNLIKLVSKAWTEGYYYRPRTDHEELKKHSEGLIVCSACIAGEIPSLVLNGNMEKASERVQWFKEVFGDDYYLELQRHKTFKNNANTETFELQQKANAGLLELAKKHNVKVVVTNDVHFTTEDDADAHDCLICVSTQKDYNDPQRMHYTKQEWLKSQEEMLEAFPDIPEGLANTQEVLDKVEFYSIDHGPIMPNFEIPEEFGTEAEYRGRISEKELYDEFTQDENGNVVLSEEEGLKKIKRLGGYDKLYRIKFEADYLKKLTMEGAVKRYPTPLSDEITERLNFELYIMKTMGFPGYFLIVQDFINTARNKLGVSVGPGRGSAAGSVVAYCLGITDVDPIKYDLLFERFLNPDRISLPDIDVDFDDDGRYTVLNYVTDKYGADKVAHIITYTTMATKSVIRDVARVMQLPLQESIHLTKLVPDRLPEVDGKAPKINLANCIKYCPEFKEEMSANPLVETVMDFATRLEGNVRNTGIHACGVIIGRDPITDWVPVSTAKDVDGNNVIVTQYEGSVIEDTGLIKMDFLGLKTLSIIKEALANIKFTRGIDLDIDHISLTDEKTFELYCKGATTATFQFESPGMQANLRELQPTKFEDLIAMNALYRPGPMAYIPQFIARKHGKEPIKYDIPIMEKHLAETYGITVYQEQVMLLSRLLAGFTRGESDMLRKAMGKKKLDMMAKLKVKFMAQGAEKGHDPAVLDKIWGDWTEFAKYAFNKSHATCYSWVAYQTAYLKANYPAEYMAGVLSRNLGVPDKLSKYMDECRAMKLTVKGPDVNESLEKFAVAKNGDIRFGLGAIKGLGGSAVAAIISERDANGPFADIYDLVERVNLTACNRSALECLALAGALDCFGHPREMYVCDTGGAPFSDILVKYGQRFQADKCSMQASLFSELEPIETNKPPFPSNCEKWSALKILEEEKRMVTMYLSAHPLDAYYMELTYGCNTPCAEVNDKTTEGENVTFGGLVTDFIVKTTSKGTPYGVLKMEDFSGNMELRLFGKNFQTFQPYGIKGTAVRVTGVVEEQRFRAGSYDIRIGSVDYLDSLKSQVANAIEISISDSHLVGDLGPLFKERTPENPRLGTLFVKFTDTELSQTVTFKSKVKVDISRQLLRNLSELGVDYRVFDA